MTVIGFDFKSRAFEQEEEQVLEAYRNALIIYMQKSLAHAGFAKSALGYFAERICDHDEGFMRANYISEENYDVWTSLAEELLSLN